MIKEALVIKSSIPETVVILNVEVQDRIVHTINELSQVPDITDELDMAMADGAYLSGKKLLEEIENERVKAKAPFLKIGNQIDALSKEAVNILKESVSAVSSKILSFQIAEKSKQREIERLENLRLAEVARKAQEAIEAGKPTPIIAEPVQTIVVAPSVAPIVSSAITTKKAKVLIIDNPAAIPYAVGNVVLLVPDEEAIKKVMLAGIQIRGCRLEEQDVVVKKRGA